MKYLLLLSALFVIWSAFYAKNEQERWKSDTSEEKSSNAYPIEEYSTPQNNELSAAHLEAMSSKGFSIVINDTLYRESTEIKPDHPILATFYHDNPVVTQIRMQHPQNPNLYIIYPLREEISIKIHESHMLQGHYSLSDFIPEDSTGHMYGKITLGFLPKN